MTQEIRRDGGSPAEEPATEELQPPLNLKENAERLPLYEELSVVLQNVLALRYPDASAEDKTLIKENMSSDTREILLPKIPSRRAKGKGDGEVPPRVKERRDERRKEQNVLDALKRSRR